VIPPAASSAWKCIGQAVAFIGTAFIEIEFFEKGVMALRQNIYCKRGENTAHGFRRLGTLSFIG
jgi:hypothetical protein